VTLLFVLLLRGCIARRSTFQDDDDEEDSELREGGEAGLEQEHKWPRSPQPRGDRRANTDLPGDSVIQVSHSAWPTR